MAQNRIPEVVLVVVVVALAATFNAKSAKDKPSPQAAAPVTQTSPAPAGRITATPHLQPAEVSQVGLMLHLPMNGTAEDASPHHRECGPQGITPTADRFGRDGGAVHFNGSALVHIRDARAFNGMNEFTLSAWVAPEIRREHLNVFSKVTPWRDFNLQIDFLGRPVSHIMADGYEFCYAKTPIPMNDWTLITATYRDRVWTMYLNGQQDSQVQVRNGPRWVSDQFTIGALESRGNESFVGKMDDLRVYSRALSAEEIQGLAGGGS